MAPGPLFAASVTYGLKQGVRAGTKMAIGHTIIELPLVILLGIGALSLDILPEFRLIITIFGALALFVFAAIQIITVVRDNSGTYGSKYGPLYAGIVFSALNPFFIIWWLTIGLKLITDAMLIWSFIGVFVMFGIHIWMDFAWLGLVSFLSSKSLKFISSRNYKLVIIGLSMIMVYIGILFLAEIA